MLCFRIIICLVMLVNAVDEAGAQGEYLETNASGFGFGASAEMADSGGGFGLWFGYSMNALLDFGARVDRFTADEDDFDGLDLHATVLEASLSFYPLRQSQYVPVTFRLGGSLNRIRFSGDELDVLFDQYGIKMKGRGWGISGELNRSIPLGEDNYFFPTFGISHDNLTIEISESFGPSVSDDAGTTSFNAALGFGLSMEDSGYLVLRPEVSLNDEETTFMFTVGLVLSSGPPSSSRPNTYSPPSPSLGRQWHRSEPKRESEQRAKSHMLTPDKSIEIVPWATQAIMKGDTEALFTASVGQLGQDQLKALSSVFKVPAASIVVFRWGQSTAPVGHPHHQTTFYVIEHGDDSYHARETIRVNQQGEVVERTKE